MSGGHPDDAVSFNDEHGYPRQLPDPKNSFQVLMRRLAEAAMSCTHHDIDHSEPEAIHEIVNMERRFSKILKGKVKPMRRALASADTGGRATLSGTEGETR